MEPSELIKLAGGCKKVAAALGLRSHTTVLGWKSIPPHHYAKIESELGVPRDRLVENLFERPAREVVG